MLCAISSVGSSVSRNAPGVSNVEVSAITNPDWISGSIAAYDYRGSYLAINDDASIITVCTGGAVYVSTNNAASWKVANGLPTNLKYYSVDMNAAGTTQVVCSTGLIESAVYVSRNSGLAWTKTSYSITNNIHRWGVAVFLGDNDGEIGVVGGGRDGLDVRYSSNLGTSFTSKQNVYSHVASVLVGNWFFSIVNNSGVTWADKTFTGVGSYMPDSTLSAHYLIAGGPLAYFGRIVAYNSNANLIALYVNRLFVTTNTPVAKDNTWREVSTPADVGTLNSLHVNNATAQIVVTDGTNIYKINNLGANGNAWTTVTPSSTFQLATDNMLCSQLTKDGTTVVLLTKSGKVYKQLL